jgi:hypothetical protein
VSAPRLSQLGAIEAAVWAQLAAAVRDSGHAWRIGVLATLGDGRADARSLVLREFDAESRTLYTYTDARSPKARQIEADPNGTLVLWSAGLGWQLRLRVLLGMSTSGLAVSSRWARLKLSPAAQDYLSPLPPGEELASDQAALQPARDSREHFGLISMEIQSLDWLELHAEGHRRALFDGRGARWITP